MNWCPGCHTVLANEQVLPDGTCERSGDVVERRNLEQWFLRITRYAEELLDALDGLDWPETRKDDATQLDRRSDGAQFRMAVAGRPGIEIEVFTTRPDTSFGMTYAVLAPEHPLVAELVTDDHRDAVAELSARAGQATDIERQSSEGRSRSEAPSPAATASTPSTRSSCRSTWPITCSWATAPGRSWPCLPRTSVTSPLPRPTACP